MRPYDPNRNATTRAKYVAPESDLRDIIEQSLIQFVYEGKWWDYALGHNFHLKIARYWRHGTDYTPVSEHKYSFDYKNVWTGGLDITDYWLYGTTKFYFEQGSFTGAFGNIPTFVVRYKKGSALAKNYNYASPLKGFSTVYRYLDNHDNISTPRYQPGDVIKYNGQYYVCYTRHPHNANSGWLSFGVPHETINSWNWSGVGTDRAWKGQTVDDVNMYTWLQNVASKASVYMNTITALQELVPASSAEICGDIRMAGALQSMRNHFAGMSHLINVDASNETKLSEAPGSYVMTEANRDPVTFGRDSYNGKAAWQNAWNATWGSIFTGENGQGGVVKAHPKSLIICNAFRYTSSILGQSEYWQPYLLIARDADQSAIQQYLNAQASQNHKKFQWKYLGSLSYEGNGGWLKEDKATLGVYLVAMHWIHEEVNGTKYLFDFTQPNFSPCPTLLTFIDHGLKPDDVNKRPVEEIYVRSIHGQYHNGDSPERIGAIFDRGGEINPDFDEDYYKDYEDPDESIYDDPEDN